MDFVAGFRDPEGFTRRQRQKHYEDAELEEQRKGTWGFRREVDASEIEEGRTRDLSIRKGPYSYGRTISGGQGLAWRREGSPARPALSTTQKQWTSSGSSRR